MTVETPQSVSAVFAVVAGHPLTQLPSDFFIPPDALEVLLDSFSGPLDILLYLIRQQNIDIMDIPMAMITQQYMQYIELLEERRMGLAADYLVMASVLIEIKSRLLLPINPTQQEEGESDPRMELVRRLQTYEMFKQAALLMDSLPRYERDVFQVQARLDNVELQKAHPDVVLSLLAAAMHSLLQRQKHVEHHEITREVLSVQDRMTFILQALQENPSLSFKRLLHHHEGRMGLVVVLLAILELARQSLVVITQLEPYASIYLQAK